MNQTETEELFQKLNQETAKITWQELQRFFASGNLILVDENLDLVNVGATIAQDDKARIEKWMQANTIKPVSDHMAIQWQNDQPLFWALVIKPWVLIQQVSHRD